MICFSSDHIVTYYMGGTAFASFAFNKVHVFFTQRVFFLDLL